MTKALQSEDITNRRVLSIALPMTLAFLSTPILGLVDTTIIGRLGRADLLGGLAIGAILFDLVFTTFNFLRSGTTGITAQALGANDRAEIAATFYRALGIGIICGFLVLVMSPLLLKAGLWAMAPSGEVETAVRRYYEIRILSAPFALANYAVLGWYIGLGRAGLGLALQLLLNGANIGLNILFVVGFEMDVEGVAWGTVLAEALTAIVGVSLVLYHLGPDRKRRLQRVLLRDRLVALFALNRDIMIRSFCLIAAFAWFTRMGAGQGDLILAGNAILINFFMVAGYFLDGFATAAEQLAGEMLGARRKIAFKRSVSLVLKWGIALAVFLTGVFWMAGPWAIEFMTTNLEIRNAANTYLPWAIVTPIIGVFAFHFDGVFIGATWSKDMRNMMLASTGVFILLSLALTPSFGNHGLWLALCLFFGMRGVTLAWQYPKRTKESFVKD